MVVNARRMDVLAEVGVGVVVTNGLVDVVLDVGMHMQGDADIDVGEAVADVAGVGGVAESGRGYGVLGGGIIECAGRRPLVGVVFRCAA